MYIYTLCGGGKEWVAGQLKSLCGASGASTKQSCAYISRAHERVSSLPKPLTVTALLVPVGAGQKYIEVLQTLRKFLPC